VNIDCRLGWGYETLRLRGPWGSSNCRATPNSQRELCWVKR